MIGLGGQIAEYLRVFFADRVHWRVTAPPDAPYSIYVKLEGATRAEVEHLSAVINYIRPLGVLVSIENTGDTPCVVLCNSIETLMRVGDVGMNEIAIDISDFRTPRGVKVRPPRTHAAYAPRSSSQPGAMVGWEPLR